MRAQTMAAAAAAFVLTGCTSAPSESPPSSTGRGRPATSSTPTLPPSSSTATSSIALSSTADAQSPAERVLATMNLRERVGQLIMIDCPSTGVSATTRAAVEDDHVGSVILDGTTHAGVAGVAAVTRDLRDLAPKDAGLFVATDQEGGTVQRLQGSGFDRIPSGVTQGRQSTGTLRTNAQTWGRQLRSAGVNVNLAPVLDVVPSGGGANPPIGDLDRQYGSSPSRVTTHGLAVVAGMQAAGVDSVVKHFPGLGRVSGNTDVSAGVTDSVTTTDDANLEPFAAAVRAKVPFVMMSTAIYDKIDPDTPAAFSKVVVTDLLRAKLGFTGVVVTDDVGAADQVASYSPGQRAVRTISAGGDMVLTVVASQAAAMTDALAARAADDSSFRKQVDAAALRVLEAKQARGLLG